jgi:Tol biopolymer transport system component
MPPVRLAEHRISAPWRWVRTSAAVAAALVVLLPACSKPSSASGGSPTTGASRGDRVTGARAFLYVMPSSGGTARPLLRPGDASRLESVSGPAWSPDGRWIAFAAGCASCRAGLYVVRRDGSDLRKIPTGPGAVSSPGWSPDGHEIVFAREQSEDQRIYAVNLRTNRVRLLNDEPKGLDNTDSTPAWSPDGSQIAFAREIHHERQNLWVIPAAGGPRRPLTRATQFGQLHPRWSPDGRRIVFMQTVPPYITWDLRVLNVRTKTVTDLTRDPHNEFDPAWSPDGESVVFASDAASRAGFRSLYVINADGSGLRRLTASSADDSMPSWSPDGGPVVFVRRPTMPA